MTAQRTRPCVGPVAQWLDAWMAREGRGATLSGPAWPKAAGRAHRDGGYAHKDGRMALPGLCA
jgi:hypothetical protein